MSGSSRSSRVAYRGPTYLAQDIATAITVLASCLTVEPAEYDSHTVLTIGEFDSPAAKLATAVYLVGSVAQCVGADLQIRSALFDETTLARDIGADVVSVIGDTSADLDFKIMQRDPWVWEAISHLLIHLAQANAAYHPSGEILVKTQVKFDVHDHGLDIVAIYLGDELGITAAECKAYLDDPARAITDASNRLKEIDDNLRDMELRAAVNQLRPSLPAKHRDSIGGTFWRQERSYFPFVCCDDAKAVDWKRSRSTLRALTLPAAKKLLVPLSLTDARKVFDEICDLMRVYVSGSGGPTNV